MKLSINGASLNYVEVGSPLAAPSVIFLHGFPFSHEMWKSQMATVGKRYRAIAYDIRGHGNSDVGDGQYTIELHVNDLIGILDRLNIERVVVVGLSMGGYIALRGLERDPGRFQAAVLCDTRSEADSNQAKLKRAEAIAGVKKTGSVAFADEFVKTVFTAESLKSKADAVEVIHKIISRTPPLAIAGTLLALAARTDTTESLANIKIPTMILVGEHDALTPPAASQAMHQRIPNSELHVIPSAAHMSNLENPAVFNEKLLSFLSRVSP